MKIKYLLFAIIVLITAITSCSDEEKDTFEGNSIKFSSTIAEQSKITQRAAGASWGEGDDIGIFMKRGEGLTTIIGGADNQRHITQAGDGNFSPANTIANAIYYPNTGTVDFIAYYPYVSSLTNYTYKVDVTNQAAQEKIDLLYSNDATGKSSGDPVVLGFNHQLTKVVFNIKAIGFYMDLTNIAVAIDGMPLMADFNLGTGDLTTTGTTASINMKATVDPSDVLKAYAEGIVIPTGKATRTFSFTFEDKGATVTYTWDASNEPFDKGKKNTYNVELEGQKVLVAPSSTIEDWGADRNEEIVIDLNRESETGLTLKLNDEKQEIDGFGFAQAYWAQFLFAHQKRDEVLDLLLGDNGLRCNIVRGEVFAGYAKSKGVYDFETGVDTNISPSDAYFANITTAEEGEVKDEYSRRGQLWLAKEAKNKYGVDKLIYSVWTPLLI